MQNILYDGGSVIRADVLNITRMGSVQRVRLFDATHEPAPTLSPLKWHTAIYFSKLDKSLQ